MSDAKPLSQEERERFVRYATGNPRGVLSAANRDVMRYEATVQAAEARAEAERERAERLLGEMALALRDFQRGDDEKAQDRLRSALAPDLMYALKLSLIGVPDALDSDDQHRAAQGEGTDDFDWTAWAHGHIAVVEQENIRLAARIRELEEAVGELLGLLDLTDHSPPCDESCSPWIEWGECTCGRAGSVRR